MEGKVLAFPIFLPKRNSLLVKITSGDTTGWGEAGQYVLGKIIIGKSVQPTVVSDDLLCLLKRFLDSEELMLRPFLE